MVPTPTEIASAPTRRQAYLAEIFDRLECGDATTRADILAKARRVIALWRMLDNVRPWQIEEWERLLAGSVKDMRAIVLRDDETGRELRHAMPFAGILTNKERAALYRQYPNVAI
jgi:hypothetical protein